MSYLIHATKNIKKVFLSFMDGPMSRFCYNNFQGTIIQETMLCLDMKYKTSTQYFLSENYIYHQRNTVLIQKQGKKVSDLLFLIEVSFILSLIIHLMYVMWFEVLIRIYPIICYIFYKRTLISILNSIIKTLRQIPIL